jgi:hypothetical protein
MITAKHFGEIYDIVERAKKHGRSLNEFERTFVEDWQAKLDRDGCRVIVSDKQQWVFDSIGRKVDILDPPARIGGDHDGDRPCYLDESDLREEECRGGAGGQEQPCAVDWS